MKFTPQTPFNYLEQIDPAQLSAEELEALQKDIGDAVRQAKENSDAAEADALRKAKQLTENR